MNMSGTTKQLRPLQPRDYGVAHIQHCVGIGRRETTVFRRPLTALNRSY